MHVMMRRRRRAVPLLPRRTLHLLHLHLQSLWGSCPVALAPRAALSSFTLLCVAVKQRH